MRRTILTVLLTLLSLISGLACARQQPMAGGKPLGHWVNEARQYSVFPFWNTGGDERRHRAHLMLADIGEPAVPALLELMRSSQPAVSGDAYNTLCNLGPLARTAVPRATEMMGSKKVDERIAAALLLGKIGPAAVAAFPELEAALNDPDERVRRMSAEALAAFGEPGRLVLARANLTGDESLRQTATSGPLTAAIGSGSQARLLDDAIRDPSPDVRAEAFLHVAPGSLSEAEEYTESLIRGMHDNSQAVQEAARRAYGRLRQSQRLTNPMLVEVLRRGDASSKTEAAWQLGMPRVPREYEQSEIAALTEALSVSDPKLRIYAARALLESGATVDVVEPTREALKSTTDIQVKLTAARVLWQATRKPEGLVELIEEGLSAQDHFVRRDAIQIAAEMAPEGAALRPSLERLVHDPDTEIAEQARRALGH